MLTQGHPIAFMSKAFTRKQLYLPVYEKEMLAILIAIKKWRHLLLGRQFVLRIDQISLKYLMDQQIHTPAQGKWLTKLFGFDYKIEYKPGCSNKVADALSRQGGLEEMEQKMQAVTVLIPKWFQMVKEMYQGSVAYAALLTDWHEGKLNKQKYQLMDGLLYYKGRLVIVNEEDLKKVLLYEFHCSPTAGHSGYEKTILRMKPNVYWKGWMKDVKQYVKECDICQRVKFDNTSPVGLLQPLPIPVSSWKDISMDFVEGLPNSQGKNVIMVVVG